MKAKRGQSTLEYVLLVTAVIVVIIGFVGSDNSPLKTAVNGTLYNAMDRVGNMSSKISSGVN